MTKTEITTMVCLHDLLGYGDMVSVSGGTLDSAVGKIAHQRISMLRKTISEVRKEFPADTTFFQMNDSAVAVCDVEHDIGSMHVESTAISSKTPSPTSAIKLLKFVCGCAHLHQSTLKKEQIERIGPAGRTFIVLGKRWPIENHDDTIIDVPQLQANLAYAEAYMADLAGSKAGFLGRVWENIYLNDLMCFFLGTIKTCIPDKINLLNQRLSVKNDFPKSILTPDSQKIELTIFHRKRSFYSIMSHHTIDINRILEL